MDSGCQANILRYTAKPEFDRNRLLFCNPANRRKRDTLTVRLSYDDGKTWPVSNVIHAGPAAYSTLVVLPDMSLGCLFEGGKRHAYETITFAHFTLEWLAGGKDSLKQTRQTLGSQTQTLVTPSGMTTSGTYAAARSRHTARTNHSDWEQEMRCFRVTFEKGQTVLWQEPDQSTAKTGK